MPWSFSHPAAVLPLRRLCPNYLNFQALVVGCISPDLGHYLILPDLSRLAHTFLGTVLADLPAGLALLALLSLLRRPLWFLLPQPHRDALAPLAWTPLSFKPRAGLVAGVSVWLGAWTHIAWDAFTHREGWVVLRVPLLQERVPLGGVDFPVYYLLQQLSTIVGAAALALAYWRWLRRSAQPGINLGSNACLGHVQTRPKQALDSKTALNLGRCARPAQHPFAQDVWRYAVLIGMAFVSLALAAPYALAAMQGTHGFYTFRVFVFQLAVHGTGTYLVLLALISVLFYFTHNQASS